MDEFIRSMHEAWEEGKKRADEALKEQREESQKEWDSFMSRIEEDQARRRAEAEAMFASVRARRNSEEGVN